MKTKLFLITSLIFAGIIFSSCQKDNELTAEKSFEDSALPGDRPEPALIDFGGLSDIYDEIEIMNYPDPFVDETKIVYFLNKDTFVRLNVHEVNSGRVTPLFEGVQPRGRHVVLFDAKGQLPGIYIAELFTDAYTAKEVMIKVDEELGDASGRH